MPISHYFDPSGNSHSVSLVNGQSLMEGAVNNNVPGMLGECGGNLSCSTCHVYVEESWLDRVGKCKTGSQEDEMLDYVYCERLTTSRLSCQIKMTPELNGVIVRIAPSQT